MSPHRTTIRQFILAMMCVGLVSTAAAQIHGDAGRLRLYGIVPQTSVQTPGRITPQLFTSPLLRDSVSFTPLEAGLPGVVAGDASWCDYNNDGRLDLYVSGYGDTGFVSSVLRNDDTTFTGILSRVFPVIPEHGVAWGDYDNDGDLDLAITGRTDIAGSPFTKIYRNDDGVLTDIHADLVQVNGGSVAWIDYDLDGQPDLFVCGSPDAGLTFVARLYRNDHGNFIDSGIPLPGVWGSAVAVGDYNRDGRPDMLISGWGSSGTITTLFRNELHQDTVSTLVNSGITLPGVSSGASSFGDYNNDGYPDIVLTGFRYGSTPFSEIFRNDSGQGFTSIGAGLAPVGVSAVAWGDFDNDGSPDLALSGSTDANGNNAVTKIYRNAGGTFTDIGAALPGTWYGSVAWGDWNNDGRLDLLVTGGTVPRPNMSYTGPYYPITRIYRNNSTGSNDPPESPGALTVTGGDSSGGKLGLAWQQASDDHTPARSLTYNLRIGTSPGAHDIVSPFSISTTGFHRYPKPGNRWSETTWQAKRLPPGTYYWSVQAIDNGYSASAFGPEQQFTVTSSGVIGRQTAPGGCELGQNYPNPFNPMTVIRYTVANAGRVTIRVFDVLGREIATLLNEEKHSGTYSVTWNAAGVPSGVYYYRMVAGRYTAVRGFVVLK